MSYLRGIHQPTWKKHCRFSMCQLRLNLKGGNPHQMSNFTNWKSWFRFFFNGFAGWIVFSINNELTGVNCFCSFFTWILYLAWLTALIDSYPDNNTSTHLVCARIQRNCNLRKHQQREKFCKSTQNTTKVLNISFCLCFLCALGSSGPLCSSTATGRWDLFTTCLWNIGVCWSISDSYLSNTMDQCMVQTTQVVFY